MFKWKKIAIFFQTINIFFYSSANLFNGKLNRKQVNSYICHAIEKCVDVLIFQHMVTQSNCKEPSGEGLGRLLQCTSFMIFQASSWGSSLFSTDGFQIQKLAQT